MGRKRDAREPRESRDVNDPRDTMRGMRKEARAEFERDEMGATGGQEHASREEREGVPASRRSSEEGAERVSRATREQSEAEALRKPHGDPLTGGAGAGGRPTGPSGEPSGE